MIEPSIYETNPLLMHKTLTLLEYAVFFGSLKIVKYLLINGFELTQSLVLFAIHSNNAEMVHLFEEQHFFNHQYTNQLLRYFEESIKCHHNDIAIYIQENYFRNNRDFYDSILSYSFRFINYEILAGYEINSILLLYACFYNYIELVKLLLNDERININYRFYDNFVIYFFS